MESTVSKMESWKDTFLILAGLGALSIGLAANYRFHTLMVWSTAFTVAASLAALHARWHIWFTRRLLIVGCVVTVIVCGVWQYRGEPQSNESQTFRSGERPYLSVERIEMRRLQAGERAAVVVTLRNRGEAPARSVRTAGKVDIKKWRSPQTCEPVVLVNDGNYVERIKPTEEATVPLGTAEWGLVRSDEVLSEDALRRIVEREDVILVSLITDYGRDGKTAPYRTQNLLYFDPKLKLFIPCPRHNEAN